MAKKVFVPRMSGLNDVQIEEELSRIKETHNFLTEKNLEWLKRYSEPYSEHEGTIITEGGTYVVYPSFDMDRVRFLQDNPVGEVWQFENNSKG